MRRYLMSALTALTLVAPAYAAASPAVGQVAPGFTLPSDRDQSIKLSDFKGHRVVVLAFYPKDETPGCTKEMQAFSADHKKFAAAGAVVFGISVQSVKSHKDFAVHCALDVPLLSDEGGKVADLYGVRMPVIGIANRKAFVIDKAGVIRQIVDGMPDNAALLTTIAKLNKGK